MSLESVVRVFATIQDPDYDSPWQPRAPSSGTGSGVVIGRRRILTGAHVVANATFLQIQKVSDPDKCTARVVGICHDIDLALLEVEDESFLEGIEPQEIGELPNLRDPVSVVGYPVGGDEISVTEGVVSRIELQRYRQSRRFFLAVTVDAAINSGNSGGPAFQDGKVIGIAFQTLKDAENIGELVPSTLIEAFLKNVDAQPQMQLPALSGRVQHLDNKHLRNHLGLPEGVSGVLVVALGYGGSAWGQLKIGDVMLELDGHRIANNGTVQYRNRLRTGFAVLLGERQIGEWVDMKVWRAGKVVDLTVELAPLVSLVPAWRYDHSPSYLVHGGLVFQQLSLDFLSTWDDWWDNAPAEFLKHLYSGVRTKERQEIVVLSNVLADEINTGYERFVNESVMTVGGTVPRSLVHFSEMLVLCSGNVEIRTSNNGLIVLDSTEAKEANSRISERYRVQSLRSEDLM